MSKKTLKFELSEEMPDSYGVYLFLMKDNSIQQAYYGSFPFPRHKYDLRICDCQYEETLYRSTEKDIIGWFKPIE